MKNVTHPSQVDIRKLSDILEAIKPNSPEHKIVVAALQAYTVAHPSKRIRKTTENLTDTFYATAFTIVGGLAGAFCDTILKAQGVYGSGKIVTGGLRGISALFGVGSKYFSFVADITNKFDASMTENAILAIAIGSLVAPIAGGVYVAYKFRQPVPAAVALATGVGMLTGVPSSLAIGSAALMAYVGNSVFRRSNPYVQAVIAGPEYRQDMREIKQSLKKIDVMPT